MGSTFNGWVRDLTHPSLSRRRSHSGFSYLDVGEEGRRARQREMIGVDRLKGNDRNEAVKGAGRVLEV